VVFTSSLRVSARCSCNINTTHQLLAHLTELSCRSYATTVSREVKRHECEEYTFLRDVSSATCILAFPAKLYPTARAQAAGVRVQTNRGTLVRRSNRRAVPISRVIKRLSDFGMLLAVHLHVDFGYEFFVVSLHPPTRSTGTASGGQSLRVYIHFRTSSRSTCWLAEDNERAQRNHRRM